MHAARMKADALAVPPFRIFGSGFVKDSNYSTVITCAEDADCLLFAQNEVEKDGHFMCPKCGTLGQRMVEASAEQCGL